MSLLKQIIHWRLWKNVFQTFVDRQGPDAVSSLAYTSLIGIVPMLAVMLGIFSVSSYFDSFEKLVMEQVVSNLMPNSHPIIEEYLLKFSAQASVLQGPGLVVMFFTTLMLLWKVDQKINSMWSERLQRKWWVASVSAHMQSAPAPTESPKTSRFTPPPPSIESSRGVRDRRR